MIPPLQLFQAWVATPTLHSLLPRFFKVLHPTALGKGQVAFSNPSGGPNDLSTAYRVFLNFSSLINLFTVISFFKGFVHIYLTGREEGREEGRKRESCITYSWSHVSVGLALWLLAYKFPVGGARSELASSVNLSYILPITADSRVPKVAIMLGGDINFHGCSVKEWLDPQQWLWHWYSIKPSPTTLSTKCLLNWLVHRNPGPELQVSSSVLVLE